MAVIKYGSIVTSGRGSLGGSTLQPCHSGNIWRNKPMPKKSRTQAQSVIRSYNKAMQAGWKALSDQDRKVWNDYAINKPVFNRTGEKHPLSGHSLWLKYQYTYLSNYLPFLSDPSDYLSEPLGPELILNGDFVDGSHWNLSPLSSIHDGALYAVGPPVGYGHNTQSSVSTLSGKHYLLRINCLAKNGFFNFFNGASPYVYILLGLNVYFYNPDHDRNVIYIYCKNGSSGVVSYISLKQIL